MKLINTKWHGLSDYAFAAFILSSPFLFGFYDRSAQTLVPLCIGGILLIYSLLTKYETGLVRGLKFKNHLVLDMITGALLALSPWIFRFENIVMAPHLCMGLGLISLAILSDTVTTEERRQQPRVKHAWMHSTAWMGHTE